MSGYRFNLSGALEQIGVHCLAPATTVIADFAEILRQSAPSVILDWRESVKSTIAEIFSSRQTKGWDGYDADPIRRDALRSAISLVGMLPDQTRMPDIVPEANGRISMEWRSGSQTILSLEVGNDSLVYASIVDARTKKHGQEPFSPRLPDEITSILRSRFSSEDLGQEASSAP